MFKDLIFFAIVLVGLFIVWKIFSKYKLPKINALSMVTGGVKSGKSTFSVYLAISNHKSNCRKVKFKNFFRKLFNKELIEMPLLYSNVPLAVPYVPVTKELLERKERFVYGSTIYIQEASLVADSQLIKDKDLNNALLLFNKLIGHETKGGQLIYDTQSIQDVHYSIKRSLSNYFYIHHLNKHIPFFIIAYVRELIYSEDGSVINSVNSDLEDDLKKVIIPKSIWKKFDCYCLSTLTDNLKVNKNVLNNNKSSNLKCDNIVSFRENFNIRVGGKNVQENKNENKK